MPSESYVSQILEPGETITYVGRVHPGVFIGPGILLAIFLLAWIKLDATASRIMVEADQPQSAQQAGPLTATANPPQFLLSCSEQSQLANRTNGQQIDLSVSNLSSGTVSMYIVDKAGNRRLQRTIGPNAPARISGRLWPMLFADQAGNCLAVMNTDLGGAVIVTIQDSAPPGGAKWTYNSNNGMYEKKYYPPANSPATGGKHYSGSTAVNAHLVRSSFLLLLPAILIFAGAGVYYLTAEIAITTSRAIIRKGVLVRRSVEMNLNKIETVDVNQSLLGGMMDYGTIILKGTGGGIENLSCVRSPMEARKHIKTGQ